MSYQPTRCFVPVGRQQRALQTMRQASAQREQHLQHVPQQQRAGVVRKKFTTGGRRSQNTGAATLADGPQALL
jgi:hypothetical protein